MIRRALGPLGLALGLAGLSAACVGCPSLPRTGEGRTPAPSAASVPSPAVEHTAHLPGSRDAGGSPAVEGSAPNLAGSSAAADGWQQNTQPETPARDEDVPQIPRTLIADNVKTTKVSVLARIVAGKIQRPLGHRRGQYVQHVYQAEVLEVFRGEVGSKLTFAVTADDDLRLHLPSHPVVLSLCGTGPDRYFVPDNGYEFAAAGRLVRWARAAGKAAGSKSQRPTACPPPHPDDGE